MRVEDVLIELLRVYSPSGQEKALDPVMRRFQRELGYDELVIDSAGNYLFVRGSGDRKVLLAGHVDTVPGQIEISRRGDRIRGRGAVDAKGPFAAMLFAGSRCEVRSGYSVVVGGLVDEEGEGSGAKELLNSAFRAEHIVIGEPTGTTGVAISYRGSVTLALTSKGRGGHSSAPYMGDSALDRLLDAIETIRSVFNGRSYDEPTSAVTVIKAGDWPTRLPEQAEAIVNVRFPPSVETRSILERVEAICSLYGCSFVVRDVTEPFQTSVSQPVPRALIRSMLKLGVRPRVVKKTGSSDMNVLWKLTMSISACGPGNSLLAHTSEEEVSIGDLELSSKIYAGAIGELQAR
ncbi:MAG: N-acetyl-lysine deacetylase [Thaumarchaeota archaeon]|nr:N-acetyl-lysine deacetylase [Candidatus Calditenuaceae archaeon]MDW8187562.1 N-acetyl-lysine deacetylase [Nitrososphaerota archaeon]